jgi:Dolichyl-phosphate-mannose-protein mannosyltransferase
MVCFIIMATIKSKAAAGPAAATEVRTSDGGLWGPYQASWVVAFGVQIILLLVFAWGPISRIGVRYSLGYNEGNAAYFTRQTMTGPGVYSAPPQYVFTDYPPLSYHVVGNLAKLSGNYVATGRWVSLFAYLAIGVLAGLIVRELSGSMRAGVYAALCWLIWLAAFDPTRIGYNDPHLLAISIGMAGLYCYVRAGESTRWLIASAVLFSLSLFTKHSLLAFPAAVAIDLYLTSRKRLGLWLGAAAALCVVLLGLTLVVDGPYFFSHLMFPRSFGFDSLWPMVMIYGLMFQVPFVAALIWALRHTASGRDQFLVWAFCLANVIGTCIVFGSGAGINHFFDAVLAMVMIAGVGLPVLLRVSEGTRFPQAALAVLLIVPFFIGPMLNIPRRLDEAKATEALRTQREGAFTAVVDFLKKQPGPALCEEPLFCFEAGKPKVFDAFNAAELIKTGQLSESTLLQMLDSRQFGAIELDWPSSDPIRPMKPRYSRFTETFVRKLFATYKPTIQTANALVFTPAK